MSNDKIMAMLNEKSQIEYYRFVAEDDEKCCDKCKEHNNKIFKDTDENIPKIPIHPNCRCKLIKIKVEQANKNSTVKNIKNVKEAVQTGIETVILPTGAGEIIGATKAAAVLATDYAIWKKRTDMSRKSEICGHEERKNSYMSKCIMKPCKMPHLRKHFGHRINLLMYMSKMNTVQVYMKL